MRSRLSVLASFVAGALLLVIPACALPSVGQSSAKPLGTAASRLPSASNVETPAPSPCSVRASLGQSRQIPATPTKITNDTIAFGRNGGIAVVDPGESPVPLVEGVDAGFVSWSPDGRRLAYVACWRELRVVDLATGVDRTVLVTDSFSLTEQQRPGFSADGRRVYGIESTTDPAGYLDVAVGVDLTNGTLVRVPMPPPFAGHGGAPIPVRSVQGSRSGRMAAWSAGPGQFFIFGPTGQLELRRVSDTPPAWNPVADQVVYSIFGRGLILLDVATGSERILDAAGYRALPAWSPDGHRIAYVKNPLTAPTIYLVDPATASAVPLVQEPASYPSWSADGQWVAYERQAQIGPGLWGGVGLSKVRADGSGTPIQITPEDGSSAPAFIPLPPGP